MSFIVLNGMPGQDSAKTFAAYREATGDLYERAGSDKAYEDIMNDLAYINEDGEVIYHPVSGADDYSDYRPEEIGT